MVQKKEKSISGHRVEVTQFAGSTANKMYVRFQQSMGPAGNILCGADEWQSFCEDFLQFSIVGGIGITNKESFDKVFAGAIGLLLRIVEFVAEVNGFLSVGDSGDTKEAGTPKG